MDIMLRSDGNSLHPRTTAATSIPPTYLVTFVAPPQLLLVEFQPDLLRTPHTSSRDVLWIKEGLLEPLREEKQTALSACQQNIRLLSSGQQLVLGAGPGCVERPWPSALGGAARRH